MPKPDEAPKATWNSLEITKLIVGALTPALIFWYGQQLTSEREAVAEAREKYSQVIKKRVELWDKLAGGLNDIYAYYLFVGHWKQLSAKEIIAKKRELDKLVYSNRPFFSDKFFSHYTDFMLASFKMNREWGKDAALRSRPIRPNDETSEPGTFTDEDNSKEIYERYFALLKFAATELDIKIPDAGSGGPPKIPQTKGDIQSGKS